MSPSPVRDLVVGGFVLAGLLAVAYLSIIVGGGAYTGQGGLTLVATFDEVGGLAARAPVRIGGVKVGQVSAVKLADDFRARVTLDVREDLALPEDTSAAILTSGVLGDQYIALEPGGSDVFLQTGEELAFTQGAFILERLISRMFQSLDGDDEE